METKLKDVSIDMYNNSKYVTVMPGEYIKDNMTADEHEYVVTVYKENGDIKSCYIFRYDQILLITKNYE